MNGDAATKTFPASGATRRMMRGSFANFFGEAVRALEHILLVPLFLWAWSDVIYGEWLIVFSVVAYLSLADVGMSNFVMNRMIQRYAVGDHLGYKRTFWSAWYLYRWIIFALFPIFFTFAFFAPFPEWFNFTRVSESSIRLAVFILGLHLLLGRLPVLFSGVYVSTGEYSRWRTLLAARDAVTIIFVGLALLFKGGFIPVASAYLTVFILFAGFVYWDVRRRHPEINFGSSLQYRDKKLAWSFIVPGLIFLLIPFAQFIKMQGSILLTGSIFGGAVVALFSIHRTLAHLIPRFVNIMVPALQHEVTATMERRDVAKVQDIHNLFLKVVLAISISAASFLFISGKDIIAVWTRGTIEFHSLLWVLLLIDVVIYSAASVSSGFQIAINKYKWYAALRVFSAAIGWILAAFLVRKFGLVGIVIGFLIPEVIIDLTIVPYLTLHIIKESAWRFIGFIGVGIVLAVLQLTATDLVEILTVHPAVSIILNFLAITVIGFLWTYLLWFRARERELFRVVCKLSFDFPRRRVKDSK